MPPAGCHASCPLHPLCRRARLQTQRDSQRCSSTPHTSPPHLSQPPLSCTALPPPLPPPQTVLPCRSTPPPSPSPGIRPCKPNVNAIRCAAADVLYGEPPTPVPIVLPIYGIKGIPQVPCVCTTPAGCCAGEVHSRCCGNGEPPIPAHVAPACRRPRGNPAGGQQVMSLSTPPTSDAFPLPLFPPGGRPGRRLGPAAGHEARPAVPPPLPADARPAARHLLLQVHHCECNAGGCRSCGWGCVAARWFVRARGRERGEGTWGRRCLWQATPAPPVLLPPAPPPKRRACRGVARSMRALSEPPATSGNSCMPHLVRSPAPARSLCRTAAGATRPRCPLASTGTTPTTGWGCPTATPALKCR